MNVSQCSHDHVWESRLLVENHDGYEMWPIEDVMPPEDTPFHKWAAAQGDEDVPAWWEVR